MSLIFKAKTAVEHDDQDKYLKLGRIYPEKMTLMPAPNSIDEYKNLKMQLREIDGLIVCCITEKASFNFPIYSIRLEASKVEDTQALQEIMQQLTNLSQKKIGKQLIDTISKLTGCEVPEQLGRDASQSCCVIA